jgi:hypothetical protein
MLLKLLFFSDNCNTVSAEDRAEQNYCQDKEDVGVLSERQSNYP